MHDNIKNITAITEVSGEGRRVMAAAIEYDCLIDAASLTAEAFTVNGKAISTVYTSMSVERKKSHAFGTYVILELAEPIAAKALVDNGACGRTIIKNTLLTIHQRKEIRSADGRILPVFPESWIVTEERNILEEAFMQLVYLDEESGAELGYNLFLPKGYSAEKRYPMVVFIHDASSCSDNRKAPLAQGNGAVVWASEEVQKEQECIVLAPHYLRVMVNDDFESTGDLELTVRLIRHLTDKLSVDTGRIYGTGQSMGCMAFCEINYRYPKLLAAALLVAGQWNPAQAERVKDQNMWIIISRGDDKAYPGMDAYTNAIKKAGGKVTCTGLDLKTEEAALEQRIRELAGQEAPVIYTWAEGRSVLPEGVEDTPVNHHIYTWQKVYDVKGLRSWLLAQHL